MGDFKAWTAPENRNASNGWHGCLKSLALVMGRSHNEEMRILISAGEASGDMYGAQLIDALRAQDPSLEFFGVGGERMRAAGCETLVDASHLAVVGISEIVSHLPKIWSLFHKLVSASTVCARNSPS
jgi:hypothetical protein